MDTDRPLDRIKQMQQVIQAESDRALLAQIEARNTEERRKMALDRLARDARVRPESRTP